MSGINGTTSGLIVRAAAVRIAAEWETRDPRIPLLRKLLNAGVGPKFRAKETSEVSVRSALIRNYQTAN